MADLLPLDMEQWRRLLTTALGSAPSDEDLAVVDVHLELQGEAVWVTWRWPDTVNSGGVLVGPGLARQLGLVG